jgi:hypothetical protein
MRFFSWAKYLGITGKVAGSDQSLSGKEAAGNVSFHFCRQSAVKTNHFCGP